MTGTRTLLALALRRDRVVLPVWLLVFVGVAAGSAYATVGIYPTVGARTAAAETVNATPALVALYGRIYDPTSLGGIAMLKMTAFGALLVGVLMVVTVVRHTRVEEESGRAELMRGAVLGRHAPLAAALTEAYVASLLLGGLTAVGLTAAGLDAGGAWAFGLSWACAGVTFASVAAVAAQLTESARAATGLAVSVLAVAFALRSLGDVVGDDGLGWVTWLSPIGWSQQIRPFGGDRWAVALLPLVFAGLLTALAGWLLDRRDLGAGLVRPRPGPGVAGWGLRSPWGLAWRLQRGQLAAWLVGFVLLGLLLGSIASQVGGMLDSPQSRDLITGLGGVDGLVDAFISADLGIAGVAAAAFGVQAGGRLRAEETAMRAEVVLAAAVGRWRWMAGHVVVALVGSSVLMTAVGLVVGVTHGARTGDVSGAVPDLLGAALVRLPAVWVLIGIAVALFGLLPRLVTGAWVALVVFVVLGQFGSVLGLPPPLMDVSPFAHVPSLPGGSMAWTPTLALLVVALALIAAGFAGLRRRDLG